MWTDDSGVPTGSFYYCSQLVALRCTLSSGSPSNTLQGCSIVARKLLCAHPPRLGTPSHLLRPSAVAPPATPVASVTPVGLCTRSPLLGGWFAHMKECDEGEVHVHAERGR